MKKIVICGGHLTPALALIEKFEKQKNIELVFFGREFSTEGNKNQSAEYKLITAKKIKFVKINAGRIQRKFTAHTIPSLVKIPFGFFQSLVNLLVERPDLVVGFGSYLSAPVVFAAWLLGIDCIIHEQATIPGLSNRVSALFAKKIFISWPQSTKYFDSTKCEVVGNLTGSQLFSKETTNAKIKNFIGRSRNLVFITGGNQGSHFLNELTRKILKKLKNYYILHQVGATNYLGDWDKSKSIKAANYLAVDYIDQQNIGSVFNKSDLIISRSGANTTWDIAVLGKVAIFIPLPISASGEQLQNALMLENAGSTVILQKDAKEKKVLSEIDDKFKKMPTLAKKAKDFSSTLPNDGAGKISSVINKLLQ